MNKEQKKRMAYREFVGSGESNITYRIQVSMGCTELHRFIEHEWDNEDGTGYDISHDCWPMGIEDLKRFVKFASVCIELSEAFEQAHPPVAQGEGVTNEG